MGRVHGDSLQLSSGETRSDMFKSLAIVCLAAAAVAEPDAKAEADAALLYGGYGYGLGLGYAGLGYGYAGSDIMVTGMVCTGLDMVTIMASVRLMLNLRLTQPFFMVPTGMVVSDTMAMLGILAMVMVSMVLAMLTTMESARLKQSLRLRLTLPYFTAPMAMVLVTMAMLGWDIMAMLVLVTMGMLVLAITDMLVWDILDIPPIMGSVQHNQRSNNHSCLSKSH